MKKVSECPVNQIIRDRGCSAALKAVDDTLYAIGGKWKLQIVVALLSEPRRFNELQRTLGKISARVLSNELKDLEQNGFIYRNVDAEATPVIVQYELTEYSTSLSQLLLSMINWGEDHRKKIINDQFPVSD